MTDNLRKGLRKINAFVLCGGLGTRLRAVLADRPKSMALVAGVPFLQLLIEQLRAQGVKKIVLGTGYMAEAIEDFFSDGSAFGVEIRYSREEKSLGTAGAIKHALHLLDDPILVLNGDSYVEWQLAPLRELLATRDAEVVMVLQKVSDISRFGSVSLDQENRVVAFVEKGSRSGEGLINAGVYLLRRSVLLNIQADHQVSLERDVFPQLLQGKVYGWISNGTFIDIGVPEDLELAQTVLAPCLTSKGLETA